MELGSKEHKNLLINNIIKTSIKTASIGLILGLFLILPSLVVINQFSAGLAHAGEIIIAIAIFYALIIALKKWFAIRHSFNNNL